MIDRALAEGALRAGQASVVLSDLRADQVSGALRLSATFDPGHAPREVGDMPQGFSGWAISRRAEFAAGRVLADAGLCALNFPTGVRRGAQRNPIWPDGISGAITHYDDQVAVLIRPGDWRVGIDITRCPAARGLDAIRAQTLSSADLAVLQGLDMPLGIAETLGFSAKETLFKALYPEVQTFFGFDAATITAFDRTTVTLCLTGQGLTPSLPGGTEFSLGWRSTANWVETWMVATR